MKRNILFLFIISLFIFKPLSVDAIETTKKMYINIDILEDGSLYVEEIAQLDGQYNGRFRIIQYANTNTRHFDGDIDSFKGSDIYNGTSIEDIKVCSTDKEITTNSFKCKSQFQLVGSASAGETGKYTITSEGNGYNIKTFNPSSTNTSFYISYIVKNAVVVHNDVAELAWNILGDKYEENIDDFKVYVNLPKEDKNLRVFLKGSKETLNGEISKVDNKQAYVYYDFLGAYNAITVRMTFDKSLVPLATKRSNVDGLDMILQVEELAAIEANNYRDRIRRQNKIVEVVYIAISILIILCLIIYKLAKDKNQKSDEFVHDYIRDLPEDYSPAVVSYLFHKRVTNEALSATVLNMLDKNVLSLERYENDKKDFYLVYNEANINLLSEVDAKICKFYISTIGDGKKVLLSAVRKYGSKSESKARELINIYDNWKKSNVNIASSYNFYGKMPFIQLALIILSLLWILISVLALNFELFNSYTMFTVILGIVLFIYAMSYTFRSKTGSLHMAKWNAFKKFLLDFGTMDEKELPEVKVWGKYLVYATVLGCAKVVEKSMKLRIEQMQDVSALPPYLGCYYAGDINHAPLSSALGSTVTSSVSASRAQIASSSYSSSSGDGGGSSFGGGSFGGGGGGGRF